MGSPDSPSDPGHRRRRFRFTGSGSTIRSVLFAGFSAVFALWLLSAYDLVQRVTEAERQAAALTAAFADGEELLFTVRAQVFLSSVYARDAVLDTNPASSPDYRDSLQAMRSEIDRALQRYAPRVDSPLERDHWTRLEVELQEYWNSLLPLVSGPERAADASAFLQQQVIPKREMVVRISDDIRALNQDALQQQQEAAAALHRLLRQRIWWTSGVAVVLGLLAAWGAAHHASRLESRIREQHVEEQQAKRELQRLSSELVQAQEHERRRIARDLHDEIGQALMTIKLDLGTIDRSGAVSGAHAQALADARATTDLAIRTVRDLSQLLHPPMLDDFGLVVTLDAFVRRFADRTGVRTELAVEAMTGRLAADVELVAYRVVQEALTNVAKHAGASSCRVSLHRHPDFLLVTIEDDGKGMDLAHAVRPDTARGVGLVGVRERVSRLGGTVRLDARPGAGTRLAIELPVASAPAIEAVTDMATAAAAGEGV